MRLKRLYLHGFKTFAPRTEIVFGEGLTAVVGPNGSGKSNIADAIRWALGEQSLSMLRAKRTEDLIFAGSSKRAPLGMAEVSLTIDNADHLLPIDFAEVTITRRAYRTGDSEYYINKSRVRLRDVLDLASVLGQAYTVVGQGLVDQALSLRPEERRQLFEEAAAIRGYFMQREDALRRLSKTEENITRLNDLAAELEPQVKRMERQARQAQEYGKLEAELNSLLRKWYTGRWLAAAAELERARSAEMAAEQMVVERRAVAAAKSQELTEARSKVWKLLDEVSNLHEQRAQVGSRHAAQSQSQAVLTERLSAAATHRQSVARERGEVELLVEDLRRQKAQLVSELDARRREADSLHEENREVAARLDAIDAQLAELQRRQNTCAGSLQALDRQVTELDARLRDAERRHAEGERALAEGEAAIAAIKQKLESEEITLDERKAEVSSAQRALIAAEADLRATQQRLHDARSERAALEEKRRELTRYADSISSQVAAVAGEQQANLYSGVRAVVAAASEGRIVGYVGTVAELVQVPAHLESAIEAALGARLQEIVMRRWEDAEQAIALLKQSGAGRATFLPLDTLRSGQTPPAPSGPGIVGLARDLVAFDPSLQPVADSLLGRLLIVEDLPSARATISRMPAGAPFTLATLGGEVVRPGGSVTGGSNAREADSRARGRTILGRERRRRELQTAHEAAIRELKANEQALEAAVLAVGEQDRDAATTAAAIEKARKAQMAAHMAHMEQQTVLSRLQQELSWRSGLLAEARSTISGLEITSREGLALMEDMKVRRAPLQSEAAEIASQVESVSGERASVASSAGESQTRLAVLRETLRNLDSRQAAVESELGRLERRLVELQTQAQEAVLEEEDISRQRAERIAEMQLLAQRLAAIEEQVGPSEKQVRVFEAEVSRVEGEQSTVQEALLEADTAYSRAAVERQRCSGVLDTLRIEIAEELNEEPAFAQLEPALAAGAVALAGHSGVPGEAGGSGQAALSGGNGHESPGVAGSNGQSNGADLERKVFALKARISRMGPVNPLAEEEHAALVQRHDFLQTQLWDLQGAADRLRRIISELDRTMRDLFAETFAQVNEAFQEYFTRLFGGGTARMELTNPEDVSTSGVDLMAQPPGKRMQPLAALSGGERALTSAAILFALLKVRPVPFCVLDEVDAALDESNVTRFRSALQELETRTQFVVITHNRGTIEAADTLYGVSMAGDGTSQLLSLKVEA